VGRAGKKLGAIKRIKREAKTTEVELTGEKKEESSAVSLVGKPEKREEEGKNKWGYIRW